MNICYRSLVTNSTLLIIALLICGRQFPQLQNSPLSIPFLVTAGVLVYRRSLIWKINHLPPGFYVAMPNHCRGRVFIAAAIEQFHRGDLQHPLAEIYYVRAPKDRPSLTNGYGGHIFEITEGASPLVNFEIGGSHNYPVELTDETHQAIRTYRVRRQSQTTPVAKA